MKYFYIQSNGGAEDICKYSKDFYELVLKEQGYFSIDSRETISTVLSAVSSKDMVHLEIGLSQKKETELLLLMLNANYKHVVVTLHHALIKFPVFDFKNSVLNSLSRFYDKYGRKKEVGISYVKKIKNIYVLSTAGVDQVKRKYEVENVHYLPHIVDQSTISTNAVSGLNLIYPGRIASKMGLEYLLELHQLVLETKPMVQFYVVGEPVNGEKAFYERLQSKYRRNVHYLGLVREDESGTVFKKATFALILNEQHEQVISSPGQLLYCLQKGMIPIATPNNSVKGILQNGKTGFYLSLKLKKDATILLGLLNEKKSKLESIKENIAKYLAENHSSERVKFTLQNSPKNVLSSDCQL